MEKKFYRVSNVETQEGLWYNIDGSFSGNIHNKSNFCVNSSLVMDYDSELEGYLSVTDSIEKTFFSWFF